MPVFRNVRKSGQVRLHVLTL
jgi:hypothetical protein